MSTLDLGIEFVVESREVIDVRIAVLEERLRDAYAEIDLASRLAGMEGPMKAAEREALELRMQISQLGEVAERVEKGYRFYQRAGFETAVDAMGEYLSYTPLSDASVKGVVYGHGEDVTRIPLDALVAYRVALETGLFERFELAVHFDTPSDPEELFASGPFYHYLVGAHSCDPLGFFFIADWKSTSG